MSCAGFAAAARRGALEPEHAAIVHEGRARLGAHEDLLGPVLVVVVPALAAARGVVRNELLATAFVLLAGSALFKAEAAPIGGVGAVAPITKGLFHKVVLNSN